MTYCCSNECERRWKCVRWTASIQVDKSAPVKDFYNYGSGFVSDRGFCEVVYSCGPEGNYAMFEPLEKAPSFKICPLKFLKKDTLTEDFKCVEGSCAWWCSSNNNCAVTSIALNGKYKIEIE